MEIHIKQGYILVGWQKSCNQRLTELNPISPQGVMAQYLLIQYLL